MSAWMLILPILIPAVGGALVFLVPKTQLALVRALSLIFTGAALIFTIVLFGRELDFSVAWLGFGIDFALKLDSFSSFIMLVAGFAFLTVVFSTVSMKGRERERQFFAYIMLTSAFVTGAMLANNLLLMVFFWEGLLALLFALIMTGGVKASSTAIKALIINGTADLCLILGVGLLAWQSGTFSIDAIAQPIDSFWSGFAFVMMMIGAIAKGGSMPFHSWIPNAADDTPTPFMAFLPAAIDKIAGIYLLARLNLCFFEILPGSGLSLTVMTIGSITIIFAVMMALIQKDFKRLLSYHAISQVGYMLLGIGTALPIGIVGGIYHMINNALYKSCLFFTAGSVERQAGTTDLAALGGLGRKMPVTFVCFLIAAAAISGVPPLNGFFSKELIFESALQVNAVFYVVAAVGAFFTAASFLKLGHAAFFGKPPVAWAAGKAAGKATGKAASKAAGKAAGKAAASKATIGSGSTVHTAKEAPWPMLVPLVVLALVCVVFGVYNPLPLQGLIEPVLSTSHFASMELVHTFAGLPHDWLLAGISVVVLLLAVFNHFYGVKRAGKSLGASDHIHYAPGLKPIYALAETGATDPFVLCGKLVDAFSFVLNGIDKGVDMIYSKLAVGFAELLALGLNKAHTGKHWMYVLWVLGGAVVVIVIFTISGGV